MQNLQNIKDGGSTLIETIMRKTELKMVIVA